MRKIDEEEEKYWLMANMLLPCFGVNYKKESLYIESAVHDRFADRLRNDKEFLAEFRRAKKRLTQSGLVTMIATGELPEDFRTDILIKVVLLQRLNIMHSALLYPKVERELDKIFELIEQRLIQNRADWCAAHGKNKGKKGGFHES